MLRLQLNGLILCGALLGACSVQHSDLNVPLVGTGHEFSYNKKYSSYTNVTVPLQGTLTASSNAIHTEIRSNLTISGYPVLDCTGEGRRNPSQAVVAIDMTCKDGEFGTVFVNFSPDRDGLGSGQFSLSNWTDGVFQFGDKLLVGVTN